MAKKQLENAPSEKSSDQKKPWREWEMIPVDSIVIISSAADGYVAGHELMAKHVTEQGNKFNESGSVVLNFACPKDENPNYGFLYAISEYVNENDHIEWSMNYETAQVAKDILHHLCDDIHVFEYGQIAHVPMDVKRY